MRKKDKNQELEEELTEEELDLDEEYEDEEEGGGKGIVLKVLLAVFIVCIIVAVGFFVLRFVQNMPKLDNSSAEVVASEIDTADDMNPVSDDALVEPEPTPTPTPTPKPTPTPTPTPSIPEKYKIPDIDPNDLTAVRAHIQSKLDEIAADIYCPDFDSITCNEDCTVFTVVCNSVQESLAEQEAVNKMYDFGRMYAAYAGTTPGNIHIDYKNFYGEVLWTRDSKG